MHERLPQGRSHPSPTSSPGANCGIGPDGVYNTDALIQDVEREMIARADRVVVLADHTKLGIKSLCRVCDLRHIHMLVTDAFASEEVVHSIRSAGVEVHVAFQGIS